MKTEEAIVGERLYLRSLVESDANECYLSWLLDPSVTQFLEIRFASPVSLLQLREFVGKATESNDSLLLGIFLTADDRHIGNIKLGPVDWHHQAAEIGLLIGDRTQWGLGHASAAIRLVVQYAFQVLKLAKLTAGCYAENAGSMKAFINAGFAQEGRRLLQWQVGTQRQDGILLGMINPSFLDTQDVKECPP
jgi:[ribosomal protein S5]-alanine N-acetyltransferase